MLVRAWRRRYGTSPFQLRPSSLGAFIAPPTHRSLRQAHLRQRIRLRLFDGTHPAHDAQQHITVPSHIQNRPHLVLRVCCSQQELVGLLLPRFAQIEHRERRQRRSLPQLDLTTTRRTCTTDVTAHTVLPFASDQHFPRRGSDAGDGLPVCAGGLFVFGPILPGSTGRVTSAGKAMQGL